MSAPARDRGRRPARSGRPGVVSSLRGALHQWLERPLTSLHLVLAVFGLLTALGLVMVLSASSVSAYAAGGSSYGVFARQSVNIAMRVPVTVTSRLRSAMGGRPNFWEMTSPCSVILIEPWSTP